MSDQSSTSPVLIFPAASPTPKLSCNTPNKKPPSPFDFARECMLDDQMAAASGWNYHFDEMERIGKEVERDSLALERLREKANPTPEERCVLSWIDSPPTERRSSPEEPKQPPATTFLSFLTRFKKTFKFQS